MKRLITCLFILLAFIHGGLCIRCYVGADDNYELHDAVTGVVKEGLERVKGAIQEAMEEAKTKLTKLKGDVEVAMEDVKKKMNTLTGTDVNGESGDVNGESEDVKEESGDVKEESGDTKEESGDVKEESGDLGDLADLGITKDVEPFSTCLKTTTTTGSTKTVVRVGVPDDFGMTGCRPKGNQEICMCITDACNTAVTSGTVVLPLLVLPLIIARVI